MKTLAEVEAAARASARWTLARIVGTVAVIVACAFMFAFGSIREENAISDRAKAALERARAAQSIALARANNVQREINGNRAMIFAVCNALHRRDQDRARATYNDALEWSDLRRIEDEFPRPNPGKVDIAYHTARRRMMVFEDKRKRRDAQRAQIIAGPDCQTTMLNAYRQGEQDPVAIVYHPHTTLHKRAGHTK